MSFNKRVLPLSIGVLVSALTMNAMAGGPDQPLAITPGIYMGIGGALNLEYMSVDTATNFINADGNTIVTTANLKNKQIDGAPLAQLGYWGMFGDRGVWGLVGEYKYLNYTLNNINSVDTVAFPNVTGLPGYGNLAVNLEHEFMLLMYLGATYGNGYFYLGLGPVLFTLTDSIRNYAGITPGQNFTGLGGSDTLWGGAAQLGYNYYFDPTWFLGFNYTYTITGNYTLNNHKADWNYWYYLDIGGDYVASLDSTDMHFKRNYGFVVQEFMFSLNKVFAV